MSGWALLIISCFKAGSASASLAILKRERYSTFFIFIDSNDNLELDHHYFIIWNLETWCLSLLLVVIYRRLGSERVSSHPISFDLIHSWTLLRADMHAWTKIWKKNGHSQYCS